MRAQSVGAVPDGGDHIVGRCGIDENVGTQLAGALQTLGTGVERNHAGAHARRELRGRQPDRTLAKNRDRMVALKTQSMERAPSRTGSTCNGRAGGKGQLIGQGHQRARGTLHVARMRAMGGHAVDFLHSGLAQLHPAARTVRAGAATPVVVFHHTHADPRLPFADAHPDGGNHTTGLMPRDDQATLAANTESRTGSTGRRAVELEVAAAHPGRLDLQHDFAWPWRGVREVPQLEAAVAGEHNAFHFRTS